MIRDRSRAGWVGASDTYALMSSWDTKTFAAFMNEKLGYPRQDIHTRAMDAGTHWEGRVLSHLGITQRDRQIRRRKLCLRVNLDGEDKSTVTEVKTHQDVFKVSRRYWMQAQVEMYATRKKLRIAAYQLLPNDLDNYYAPFDDERLTIHAVCYDERWIKEEYLPRLKVVTRCIKKRRWPSEDEIARFSKKRGREADPVAAAS